MTLPNDTAMLLSFINTKLRDCYGGLDALCDDLQVNRRELEEKLGQAGFEYNEQQKRFW